ncbi:MAG: BufA1 family periplasmic bufferin-type metallophore [Inquilinaceae bacterium]
MADMKFTSLSVAAALAGAVSMATMAAPSSVLAQDMTKCYGVAKAAENDCANAAGTHSCAGQSTEDYFGGDWKLVPAGSCEDMGGQTEPFDGYGEQA